MGIEHGITLIPTVGDRIYAVQRLIIAWASLFERSLLECDLAFHSESSRFSAIARFDSQAYGPEVRARFHFWASRAGVTSIALTDLQDRERSQFLSRLEQSDVKLKSVAPKGLVDALDSLWTRIGIPPERRRMPRVLAELELDLGTVGRGVTYDASEGGLFVRGNEAPPLGDTIQLALTIPGVDTAFELAGRIVHIRTPEHARPGNPPGFGIAFLSPPQPLLIALSRHFAECDPKPRGEDRRTTPRYAIHAPVQITASREVVRLRYSSEAEFSADYVQNLSVGGAFVRTSSPFPRDTLVSLEIHLPDGTRVTAPGKVVHSEPGGMGVQFQLDDSGKDMLASVIVRLAANPRRALLLDSDFAWRELLSKELVSRGFEVLSAGTGSEGVQVIFEELLSLEVLVTDLDLPGLGTEALVDIIRRAGGEEDLAIIVVARAASSEIRDKLRRMGVDGVLDRESGAPTIAKQISDLLADRRRLNPRS